MAFWLAPVLPDTHKSAAIVGYEYVVTELPRTAIGLPVTHYILANKTGLD